MSTTSRGYGVAHKKERERWRPIVQAGEALCARCDEPIDPEEDWHLDHTQDRTGYIGVSHADCNIKAGARLGGKLRSRKGRPYRRTQDRLRPVSRDWLGDAVRIDGRLYRPMSDRP